MTPQTTCPDCDGRRYTVERVPNLQGPSNNRYQSAIRPYVDRRFECETCGGTGRVDDLDAIDAEEAAVAMSWMEPEPVRTGRDDIEAIPY